MREPMATRPSAFSAEALEETLTNLVGFLSDCRDPWCIFGGAALYLHGYRDGPVADIDVLLSPADCGRLTVARGLDNRADGGTDRFRSGAVLYPNLGPIAVEIMSGFEIFADRRWHEVAVETVTDLRFGSISAPVASIRDVGRILRLIGREKDIRRLELIGSPP